MMERHIKIKNRLFIAGTIAIMIVHLCFGCATLESQNIGRYKENPEITLGFQSHQYFPEYAYYYAGLIKEPEAIVGIHRNYRIQENSDWGSSRTRWKELETTAENLKKLVDGINKNNKSTSKYRSGSKPSGFVLSDPAGKQVGILYVQTNRYFQPRIRVFEDNRVNIVAAAYVGPRFSAR